MEVVDLPRILPFHPMRMSVEKYHALTRAGAFAEHDRVELLDGVVTEKMPKNPPHRTATRRCDLALSDLAPKGWHVQNQEPITLQRSEPEPDIAIVRGTLEDYNSRHPGVGDIALVIEIADATIVTDRFKAQLYAHAEIPEYWIVNLNERVIESHRQPEPQESPPLYRTSTIFTDTDEIPVTIGGIEIGRIKVADLLPPVTHNGQAARQ
ncbi:MAG: Uma2 family endonuclease [Pirellulaceae bacterium]